VLEGWGVEVRPRPVVGFDGDGWIWVNLCMHRAGHPSVHDSMLLCYIRDTFRFPAKILKDIHELFGERSQDRSWFLLSGSRRSARVSGGLGHIRGGARRNHHADADEILRHPVCITCHDRTK